MCGRSLIAVAIVAGALAAAASPVADARASAHADFLAAVWSPSGKQIAWVQADQGSTSRIWIAAADGSHARPVTGAVDDLGQIAWLRSGQLLYWADFRVFRIVPGKRSAAFIADVTGPGFALNPAQTVLASGSPGCPLCAARIALIPLRGGRTRYIGHSNEQDMNPSFAPNGSELAYDRTPCAPDGGACDLGPTAVWVTTVDDHHLEHRLALGACPLWSPSGRWLLFGTARGAWLAGPNGGRPTRLAGLPGGCNPSLWSPNSKEIAVADPTSHHVDILDLTTRRVLAVPQSGAIAWSPDSRHLLIASLGSMLTADASTGTTKPLRVP